MLHRLMKGSRALTFVLALALMFSLTACDDDSGGGGMDPDPDPELLSDILGDRNDLSTLFQAVEASGQLNLTQNPDADITVFAPNNAAFADINLDAALSDDNSDLLSAVVQYHVLPQSVLSSGLSEGTVTTSAGDDIRVTTDEDGNFLINGNAITTADLEADNGVLHVIDGLLLENRTLVERLGLTSSTQALAGLASEAGLAEDFAAADNWTVFAPINGALENVDPADFSPEQLQQILQYHVIDSDELADIDGPIDAATLESLLSDSGGELEVETLQGESITFTETDSGISINGNLSLVDGGTDRFAGGVNEAGDGFMNVFHLIDGLLMPPSMQEPTLLADILGDRDDLSTLFQAVEASGQLNLTQNPDADITVFAPNNAAFADINLDAALSDDNSDLLSAVVQYHVLPQSVLSSGLSEGTVTTAAGDDIRITTDADDNFLINGNSITAADLEADNGVLHVIDGLLLENRTLAQRLVLTTPTTQLAQLAESIGAAGTVGDLENATLFAPRNIQDAVAETGFDLSDQDLTNVLLYHVVNTQALVDAGVLEEAGPIDSETLIGLLQNAEGNTVDVPTLLQDGNGGFETITIALNDDESITINDGQATLDQDALDKFTDNFSNVFHVIDGVLLPPSITTTTLLGEDFSDEAADPFSVVDAPGSGSSWGIATFENDQSPYMQANGFGADTPSNTWLISPALDFSANSGQTLSFANAKSFDDGGVETGLRVKVSTDYNGTGNPEDFTWTDISDRVENYSEGGYEFVESGEIDVSDEDFQSESVYVAFQYISSGTGPGTTELWQVDDVTVTAQR